MTKFTFKIKRHPRRFSAIGAPSPKTANGSPNFQRPCRCDAPRDADSSYNVHRDLARDRLPPFRARRPFRVVGRHAEVLKLLSSNFRKPTATRSGRCGRPTIETIGLCSTFVEGLTAGGCCWFGSTPGQDCRRSQSEGCATLALKSMTGTPQLAPGMVPVAEWAPAPTSAARSSS